MSLRAKSGYFVYATISFESGKKDRDRGGMSGVTTDAFLPMELKRCARPRVLPMASPSGRTWHVSTMRVASLIIRCNLRMSSPSNFLLNIYFCFRTLWPRVDIMPSHRLLIGKLFHKTLRNKLPVSKYKDNTKIPTDAHSLHENSQLKVLKPPKTSVEKFL